MNHRALIEQLGNGTKVAAWVSKAAGETVDREAVYKWAANGIPWKWRPFVAQMAQEQQISLPAGFLPGVGVA